MHGPLLPSGLEDVAMHHPHELALLFSLLACGTTVSIQGSDESEGRLYGTLARAALGLQSIFDDCSLHAFQAVYLLGAFEAHVCRSSMEGAWRLRGLALCLASSVRILAIPFYAYG